MILNIFNDYLCLFIFFFILESAFSLFFIYFVIQLFKTNDESITSYFSIGKIKILFNRIRSDLVTIRLFNLWCLYIFFLTIMLIFFFFLIFLSYKIINEHVANHILLQQVNRLEQEIFALKMSYSLSIDFFQKIGLIEENFVSMWEESSLNVKETVAASQFSDWNDFFEKKN